MQPIGYRLSVAQLVTKMVRTTITEWRMQNEPNVTDTEWITTAAV